MNYLNRKKLMLKPLRQGDVLLIPTHRVKGERLSHLTLAEGEVTGHRHRISQGKAELYQKDSVLYLSVVSDIATLSHEEHQAIQIPKGSWMIRIQREYQTFGWHSVMD